MIELISPMQTSQPVGSASLSELVVLHNYANTRSHNHNHDSVDTLNGVQEPMIPETNISNTHPAFEPPADLECNQPHYHHR